MARKRKKKKKNNYKPIFNFSLRQIFSNLTNKKKTDKPFNL